MFLNSKLFKTLQKLLSVFVPYRTVVKPQSFSSQSKKSPLPTSDVSAPISKDRGLNRSVFTESNGG